MTKTNKIQTLVKINNIKDHMTKSVRHSVLDGDRVDEINNRPSYSGPGYHYYFTASLVTAGNRKSKWWGDVEWDFDNDGTCCGPSDF